MRFRSVAGAVCALTVIVAGLAPFVATAPAAADAVSYVPSLSGYWSTDAAGLIRRSGDAPDFGDLRGVHLNAPIVGIAATGSRRGYWLAAADGGVFTFGDARFYGSTGGMHLNAPIVGMASSGRGYWLVASDGGVFTFGDAKFYGSAGAMHLNAPIVGIESSGHGYWLAASDGGVFTFGDAKFLGSAGDVHLNAPIVGIAGGGFRSDGYRLAASDGGVFTYGNAPFAGVSNRSPISAIATSPFGGYVLQSDDGSVSAFGNAASCSEVVPLSVPAPRPRFVGVAPAFSRSSGDPEGGMAQVSCPGGGGHTGAFHAPARWHVDARSPAGQPCLTLVFGLDRVGNQPVPTRPLVAKYGSIQMRRTQMAGHSVFDVRVTGTNCRAVATRSFVSITLLPLAATTRAGDLGPFGEIDPGHPGPFTLKAHGTCTTEIRDNGDGRLLQRKTGSSYMTPVPVSGYWISNTPGCIVSIS